MELSCCKYCNQEFIVGSGFLEDGCAQYCKSKCWFDQLVKFSKEKLEKLGHDFVNEYLKGYPKDSQLLLLLEIRVENLENRLNLLSKVEDVKVLQTYRFYKENHFNSEIINSEENYRLESCPDCFVQRKVQYQPEKNALVYGKCKCNTISSMFSHAYAVYQQNEIKNTLDNIQQQIKEMQLFEIEEYNLEGVISLHEARWIKGGSGLIKLTDGQEIKFYREHTSIYYCTEDKVLEAKLFLYLTNTINKLLDLQMEKYALIDNLITGNVNEASIC